MLGYKITLAALLATLSLSLHAQEKEKQVALQTPRQAVIEMICGGEDAMKKHLTVDVQKKLAALAQTAPYAVTPLQTFALAKSAGAPQLQSFDFGAILLYVNNPEKNERVELHVDADNLRSDEEDDMELSLHSFHSGEEQPLPVGLRFLLNLRLQEGIWRLNALTFSARVPFGDPRILDRSWWNVSALGIPAVPFIPEATEPPPRIEPFRAVRLVDLAENLYAQKHPESGFTCRIADLINIGKGLDSGERFTFMDPEFAGGVYNGYKFVLSGCAGKPARSFHITAEPVSGPGRAFCSDNTSTIRSSEDGFAVTCLASGKITRR